MSTWIVICAIAIFIFLTIVVHEYGHFREMQRLGVPIKAIVVGAPLPYISKYRILFNFEEKNWPPIFVYPLTMLLGGCIWPEKQLIKIEEEGAEILLEFKHAAVILGAGAINNIILGVFFFGVAAVVHSSFAIPVLIFSSVSVAIISYLIWKFRVFLSRYVLLLVGVGLLIWILSGLISLPYKFGEIDENTIMIWEFTKTTSGIWIAGGSISALTSLMNCMPILPLDGGRMALCYIIETWPSINLYGVRKISFWVLHALIVLSIFSWGLSFLL